MKKNLNTVDRIARLCMGLLLLWLLFLTNEDLLLSMLSGLLGIYFLITSSIGICTFYLFLGLNSAKTKNKMH